MQLRPLGLQNLEQVLQLATAADPYSWPENIWRQNLNKSWVLGAFSSELKQLLGLVVVAENLYESELLYLVVAASARRQGIAKHLLQAAINYSQQELNSERLMLEVRRSNLAAQKLYLGQGFVEEGQRKNYYPITGGGSEDALLFSRWFV